MSRPACLLTILLLPTFSGAADLLETVRATEAQLGARVGFFLIDEASGEQLAHRADERFPLNSTFKTMACAALLDAGDDLRGLVVQFAQDDLVEYSPVTEQRTGEPGMSLDELCESTMTTSDNTAANLVLEAIGGPAALTEYFRSIGDETSRLDRFETELNEARPGDPRDTTSPRAIAGSLRHLVLGDGLPAQARGQLRDWLVGNAVSEPLFRTGVPADWIVGDRTGAGGYGSRSITAVLWPPGREPLVAVVYITETDASFDERNAAIADIARAIADYVSGEGSPSR